MSNGARRVLYKLLRLWSATPKKRLRIFSRGAIMRKLRGRGSAGRAMRSQRIGQGFESPRLHQNKRTPQCRCPFVLRGYRGANRRAKRFSFKARIDFQMCEGGQKCAPVRRLTPQDAFALYRRRERVGKQAGRRAYAQDDIMAKLPSSSYVSAGTLRRVRYVIHKTTKQFFGGLFLVHTGCYH